MGKVSLLDVVPSKKDDAQDAAAAAGQQILDQVSARSMLSINVVSGKTLLSLVYAHDRSVD